MSREPKEPLPRRLNIWGKHGKLKDGRGKTGQTGVFSRLFSDNYFVKWAHATLFSPWLTPPLSSLYFLAESSGDGRQSVTTFRCSFTSECFSNFANSQLAECLHTHDALSNLWSGTSIKIIRWEIIAFLHVTWLRFTYSSDMISQLHTFFSHTSWTRTAIGSRTKRTRLLHIN